MPTDPLQGLEPTFLAKLQSLLRTLAASGTIMRPYFGVRDCVTQGKLWRQSRSTAVIIAKVESLKAQGAHYIADAIIKAGPATGPWATNAIPGYSWHQHRNAMDCVWMRHGHEEWSVDIDGAQNGYRLYAAAAPQHGLTSLASLNDWGHVQGPAASSPASLYSLQQIDALMRAQFG